jgi:hypothetical protein
MGGRNGSDSDGSDDTVADDSLLGAIVRNPLALIFAALIGGGTGGTFFGRPDPFTGDDGKILRDRIVQLETAQAVDNEHRKESRQGYIRIRYCENQVSRLQEQVQSLRKERDRDHR